MKMYTYVITRDYGFAPNPFGGICTLATCKPSIRKNVEVGDWIIATGPKTNYHKPGFLFFAMKVKEKISYNEYWNNDRFQDKKPIFNGSLKQCYGDNIYYFDESLKKWHQEDSHHSLENGEINIRNLKNDTSAPFAIISDHFYYFGNNNTAIPKEFVDEACNKKRFPVHRIVKPEIAEGLIKWLEKKYETGILGDPMEFKNFKRYNGK